MQISQLENQLRTLDCSAIQIQMGNNFKKCIFGSLLGAIAQNPNIRKISLYPECNLDVTFSYVKSLTVRGCGFKCCFDALSFINLVHLHALNIGETDGCVALCKSVMKLKSLKYLTLHVPVYESGASCVAPLFRLKLRYFCCLFRSGISYYDGRSYVAIDQSVFDELADSSIRKLIWKEDYKNTSNMEKLARALKTSNIFSFSYCVSELEYEFPNEYCKILNSIAGSKSIKRFFMDRPYNDGWVGDIMSEFIEKCKLDKFYYKYLEYDSGIIRAYAKNYTICHTSKYYLVNPYIIRNRRLKKHLSKKYTHKIILKISIPLLQASIPTYVIRDIVDWCIEPNYEHVNCQYKIDLILNIKKSIDMLRPNSD